MITFTVAITSLCSIQGWPTFSGQALCFILSILLIAKKFSLVHLNLHKIGSWKLHCNFSWVKRGFCKLIFTITVILQKLCTLKVILEILIHTYPNQISIATCFSFLKWYSNKKLVEKWWNQRAFSTSYFDTIY